jgi:hypothetical protein
MLSSLKRKPIGTPSNTQTTNDDDDQPWATARLYQHNYAAPTSENDAMPNRASDKIPVTPEPEQRNDNETEDADAITPLPPSQVYIDPIAGHSNVTIPARPDRRHALSELFEIDELEPGFQVRSPSGNMLSAEQVALREDRPMGIRERQEKIRRRVAEQRQGLGNEVTITGDAKGKEKREKELREQREKGENGKREKMKAKAKALSGCRCQ